MTNLNNHGTVTGKLAADPKILTNKDGSRKIFVTVYADNNWKGKDGKRGSKKVPLEAFVRKDFTSNGAFDYLHKGDVASFGYEIDVDSYEKNGQTVYETKLEVQDVQLRTSKADSERRVAERVAKEATAAAAPADQGQNAAAPASAPEEDSPFGA